EAWRFGLGSFKALGGAYAVSVLAGPGATVTCATDGNHGRSVAWGAERVGCRAVIYVHPGVSSHRRAAIAGHGAEVVVVPGTYDDVVVRAAADAVAEGRIFVSDTSFAGDVATPKLVMQGYSILVDEVLSQLRPGETITHVFVQGGVGGLAA